MLQSDVGPNECHIEHLVLLVFFIMCDGGESATLFQLAKKIKGMEVAWGQGLSYALVHEFHKTQKATVTERVNATVVDQIMSYIYSSTSNVLSYLNIIS